MEISVSVATLDCCITYYVNRDTLFCYHKASEAFLHRLMSLYVASHYKVIANVDCSFSASIVNGEFL